MIVPTQAIKIFIYVLPVDGRKSFDGLAAIVQEAFPGMLFTGQLFVFLNKRKDRIKILYWDRDGLAIWSKRLEKGTFQLPRITHETKSIEITSPDLSLILSGIEIEGIKRRKRYKIPENLTNSVPVCV